jgi:hypothetical protein
MSQAYHGRHRHSASTGRRRSQPQRSGLVRALRRPAVTSSILLAVLATSAAGLQAGGGKSPSTAAFTVSTDAIDQANELSDTQIEDMTRLAADRNGANVSIAAAQEGDRVRALAAAKAAAAARQAAAEKAARDKVRAALAAKKQALLANAQADPRAAARALLGDFGFDDSQWGCLDKLWMGESGWRYTASNSSSGAYGIPQALPGSKMAGVGSDWQTNPVTQIKWGLSYIKRSYGTPCGAWNTWQSRSPHWY